MKTVIDTIRKQFTENPVRSILLLALFVRLIAVFFAKGYMMHDDHFLTIEPSSSWAAGKNFNDWIPTEANGRTAPEPISFFYLGVLFTLFKLYQFLGLENPETQMFLMRLLHAFYSLLTVYFAYRITLKLDNKESALKVGLLIALIGVMPNFSVRNLVEFVCMPPLLGGMYLLIKNFKRKDSLTGGAFFSEQIGWGSLLLAAVIMGLAVGVRYQTGLFVAMTGLVILLRTNFINAFLFGVVSFAAFFLTQIDDVIFWGGKPFQHLQGYFAYNSEHANAYPGAPMAYLSFLGYFILPPVSLMLLAGFIKSWKKYLIIAVPVTSFVLFHVFYPNRQERFILPALPFFVIIGVIGWNKLVSESTFWASRVRLHTNLWRVFWVMNTLVLVVFSTTYSKRARVESMLYLYNSGDCRNFVLEFTDKEGGAMMPQYYSGCWTSYYYWNNNAVPAELIPKMNEVEMGSAGDLMPRPEANYYLFYDGPRLEQRIAEIRKYYPDLKLMAEVEPGWFDVVLHKVNDKNALERIFIYKTEMKFIAPTEENFTGHLLLD